MRRALVVGALILLPTLAAGCTFPQETEQEETALGPPFTGIRGLTPDARSHPVALHITPDGRHAYVALAGTIARPDQRIAVIDLEQGVLDHHIEVGPRPLAMEADPMRPDRILVAHPYAPWLSILDTERGARAGTLPVPYYIEDIAFSPDGDTLVAVDRDRDRLIVYTVDREGDALSLEERATLRTGPNPAAVAFVPPGDAADWDAGRLVAVTDRHGASITLADLQTGTTRRVDTGGAPLAVAARDGLVFVAGYAAGNGTGTPTEDGRRIDNGSAAVENSLLVIDLRRGPALIADPESEVTAHRFVSDTAHPERAHETLRLLGGASPRALVFDETPLPRGQGNATDAILWVAFQGTDQVQALHYTRPDTDSALPVTVLQSRSASFGERLSNHDSGRPLGPGRLGDIVHGLYETPPGPVAVARVDRILVTVAEFPELLHLTDLTDCPGPGAPLAPCRNLTVGVVDDPRPYPSGPFENGERLFFSALPSADQDRACASCHVDGLTTGQTIQPAHRDEPVRIPRLDQVADNAPWLLDGSVQRPEEYLRAAGGGLLRPDPGDPANLAVPANDPDAAYPGVAERLRSLTANATSAEDYMRHTFAWALGERRVLPAPPRLAANDLEQGMRLFENQRASCVSCHVAGGEEARMLTPERSEEIPRPPGAERIKAPAFGGLWDRQGSGFLYDARAATIQEAILPEGHRCLDEGATGHGGDWHGDLSDRTCDSIDALVRHILAQNGR